ncbi:YecA family protein [Vibrio sp. AK197]|uniref:UPF0149 protein ACFFUV_09785 n=1 Tax=Vibrio olivae TaxID=1243002 RepID=A0ABV5HM90_9VIBR
MSETSLPEYQSVASTLQSASLAVTPAELHGLLCGMLSGGLNSQDQSWQPILFDYTNDGMAWPSNAAQVATSLLELSSKEFHSNALSVSLLLPDDDSDIFQQADAVSDWVNHFISGLGLIGADIKKASKEAKEALADLEEIAKLGIDEDDDLEEQGALLIQVIEHIKVCVLTVHAEFGVRPSATEAASPTIH